MLVVEATETRQRLRIATRITEPLERVEVKLRPVGTPHAGGGGGESRVRPVGRRPVLPYGNIRYTSFDDHRPIPPEADECRPVPRLSRTEHRACREPWQLKTSKHN